MCYGKTIESERRTRRSGSFALRGKIPPVLNPEYVSSAVEFRIYAPRASNYNAFLVSKKITSPYAM